MPRLGPIKRRDLIRYLRLIGFEGPYSGGKHQFMAKGAHKIRIPNPHGEEIGVSLLKEILRQAGISAEDWDKI